MSKNIPSLQGIPSRIDFAKMNQSPTLTTSHNGDMCSAVDASSPRPYVIYPLST